MNPLNSAAIFKNFLSENKIDEKNLDISQLVNCFTKFYESIKFDGLTNRLEADMLLVQWGTFDWGEGENFEFNLTRQFIISHSVDDEEICQLSFTAYFKPTEQFHLINSENYWCESINELGSFTTFIYASKAYNIVKDLKSLKTNIWFEFV
ncbi:MAG: hypothetical protein V4547_20120 [Bacteroidota bacterium]